MVGGGLGAFIGPVHRMAARLDDRYEFVAGALSSDPARARRSALDLGLAPDRTYGSFAEMARQEKRRADKIDAVAIVTPNNAHVAPAKAFLRRHPCDLRQALGDDAQGGAQPRRGRRAQRSHLRFHP